MTSDEQRGGNERGRRRDHREREVAGVAGADEDAVEHEDDRGQRLHQRDDQQDRPQLVADRRVVA